MHAHRAGLRMASKNFEKRRGIQALPLMAMRNNWRRDREAVRASQNIGALPLTCA